jgi:hypothetical protein
MFASLAMNTGSAERGYIEGHIRPVELGMYATVCGSPARVASHEAFVIRFENSATEVRVVRD